MRPPCVLRYLSVSYGKVFHQKLDDAPSWSTQAEFADNHTYRGLRGRAWVRAGGWEGWRYNQYMRAAKVTRSGPTLSTVAQPPAVQRPHAPGVGLAQPPSPTGAHVARLGACMSPVGLTPSGQWRTVEDSAPTVCAQVHCIMMLGIWLLSPEDAIQQYKGAKQFHPDTIKGETPVEQAIRASLAIRASHAGPTDPNMTHSIRAGSDPTMQRDVPPPLVDSDELAWRATSYCRYAALLRSSRRPGRVPSVAHTRVASVLRASPHPRKSAHTCASPFGAPALRVPVGLAPADPRIPASEARACPSACDAASTAALYGPAWG